MENFGRKILPLSISAVLALNILAYADTNENLGDVDIVETKNNTTEETNSYTIKSMNTSTKLNLAIKDTPQSVSVLTHEQLEDMGVTSYQEMLKNVSGVTLNRWDERTRSSARGFEIDYFKIDGMPTYNEYNARDLDLSIYDRVEIVKGANGLTTGAGNPGISINLVRKKANSKVFKGDVTTNFDNEGTYGVTGDISTPITEDGSIRARVVVKHEDEKSFMDKFEKVNNLIYGVVDADITDSTFLSVGASYQKIDKDGVRWGGLPAFYSDGSKTNFDRSKTATDDWTRWNTDVLSIFADLKQYIYNDISLNLSYSYDDIEQDTALLYFAGSVNKDDGSGISYMDWEAEQEDKIHNADVNLDIPFEVGGLSQEIIIGGSYNLSKQTKYDGRYPGGYYSTLSNFYDYNTNLAGESSSDIPYIVEPEQVEQKGVYIAGKFTLLEPLKLIAGARVSSYKYTSDDDTKETRKFSNEITPYAGLILDINENHSIYTSYTSIFQPQDEKDTSGSYLDPIEGKSYEAGIKGEYFNGRLNASVGVFRIEQENVAEAIDGVFVDGATQAYKGVDGVVSKGVELDIAGEITDNLSMSFNIANFEAKDANDDNYNTKASRTTANIFAKYRVNSLYTIGGGVNYKSKYYTEVTQGTITQDDFYIVNLMGSVKLSKDLKLQMNIHNLLDEEYYDGIGANSMVYGDPRTVSLSLKYTF